MYGALLSDSHVILGLATSWRLICIRLFCWPLIIVCWSLFVMCVGLFSSCAGLFSFRVGLFRMGHLSTTLTLSFGSLGVLCSFAQELFVRSLLFICGSNVYLFFYHYIQVSFVGLFLLNVGFFCKLLVIMRSFVGCLGSLRCLLLLAQVLWCVFVRVRVRVRMRVRVRVRVHV